MVDSDRSLRFCLDVQPVALVSPARAVSCSGSTFAGQTAHARGAPDETRYPGGGHSRTWNIP